MLNHSCTNAQTPGSTSLLGAGELYLTNAITSSLSGSLSTGNALALCADMCAAPRSFIPIRSSSSRIPIAALVSPSRISDTAMGIATSACIRCAAINTFLALATRYGRLYANPATRCATPTYVATSAVSHGALDMDDMPPDTPAAPTARTQSIDSTSSTLVICPNTLETNSGVIPGCDPLIIATNVSIAAFLFVTPPKSSDSFSVSTTASDFKSASA